MSDDATLTQRLLDLVPDVPVTTWGRDELATGDMWNSNSLTSWLLARGGVPTESLTPPDGGQAPGWAAGLVLASRQSPGHASRTLPRSDCG